LVANQTVGKISGNAAENQAECDLTGQRVRVEVMASEKQRDKREQRDEREGAVVAAKQTPGRAGVTPVNKFEKTGYNDFFVVVVECAQHEPFGELVERENNQREHGDAPV